MSSIDWSDPDEMLGLLIEYVADEASALRDDPERERSLRRLARELGAVARHEFETARAIELSLREILDSQPREFASDPVLAHLEACVDELQRIGAVHRSHETPTT